MRRKKTPAYNRNNSSALLNAEHRAAPECPPRSKLPDSSIRDKEVSEACAHTADDFNKPYPMLLVRASYWVCICQGHRSSGATFTRNFFGKQYKNDYFYWWCVIRSCFVCTLLQGEQCPSQDLFQKTCRVLQEPVYTKKCPPTCLTEWHLGFIGPSKPSCILLWFVCGQGTLFLLRTFVYK